MSKRVVYIRTAGPKDIENIRALLIDTWHDTYDALYGFDKVRDVTDQWHSMEALNRRLMLPNSEFVVADTGKEILGMAFALLEEKTIKLHQLYVDPSAQGSGIGGQLLDEILNCFDNALQIELEVEPANQQAIGFYKRYGFEITGKTENCGEKQSGIPALVLSRPLLSDFH